jgi:hypothetical protein
MLELAMKRFGLEYGFIVNILETRNKKVSIQQEYTTHSRLEELAAAPLKRGAESWWATVVMAMATLDAFVHQDIYYAIAKAKVFREEE